MPLASVKYYLREGLLMPGTATAANQAEYGEEHVRRLGLIKALTDVVGLSVAKAREVLRLIDEPGDLFDTLGPAVAALPPYVPEQADYPRARAALGEARPGLRPAIRGHGPARARPRGGGGGGAADG